MHVIITFDYSKNVIYVEKSGYKPKPYKIKDAVNEEGQPVKIKWGQTWALVILNYILNNNIPFKESKKKKDVVDHLEEQSSNDKFQRYADTNFDELANRVRTYLNNNPLKDYDFLQISNDYRLPESVNEHEIDWKIICKDYKGTRNINQHFADKSWQGSYRPAADYSASEGSEKTVYTVTSTDKAIHWSGVALGRETLEAESKQLKTIDDGLLPAIKRNEEVFGNLSDYLLSDYLTEDQTQERRSFAIIEGRMGSGKTYSLKKAVSDLRENNHITVLVSARDMLSAGRRSLFDCLSNYIEGFGSVDNEQRVRKILNKETAKVVIIIDGLDEALASSYPSLALDINKIGAIGKPNVYIILSTRNASSFIKSSGIIGDHTHFKRCENLYICPLDPQDDRVLRKEETNLQEIIAWQDELKTPLFISYYREIQSYADESRSDNDRRRNLYQYTGRKEFPKIDNYYDLFAAKTFLLGERAESRGMSKEWYYSVLPALCYYLYKNNCTTFTVDTIRELFETPELSKAGYEFEWINNVINDNYSGSREDFETMYPEEKLLQLMNTGLVAAEGGMEMGEISDDNYLIKEHIEYIRFLTAMFISRIAREIDDSDIRHKILKELSDRTSHHTHNDEMSRIDKMGFIPIAYYTVLDIMSHGTASRPDLLPKTEQNKLDCSIRRFDPDVYQIAANAVYEKRELWYQTSDMTEALMDYSRGRVFAPASRPAVKGFDDWQLIEAVSGISYVHIRKLDDDPNKWNILQTINSNLNMCAAIIMHDVFKSMGKSSIYTKNSQTNGDRWNEILSISNIQSLTDLISNGSRYASGAGFPMDLIGKVYSNIGAAKQEMAKYIHKEDAAAAADYLKEAKAFHYLTLKYRITSMETMPEEVNNISVIRSLITTAADAYYEADYTERYGDAAAFIGEAVNYHFSALKRQGLDPEEFAGYTLDDKIPVERTLDVKEIPQVDGEPFVICPRIAGAYYLLYEKTCSELEKAADINSEEEAANLRHNLQVLAEKQLIYLRAAYLFLREECYAYGEDKKTLEANGPKLEMNTHEIDLLYRDAADKYVKSFRFLENKLAGRELLESIQRLYKDLHPHSNKMLFSENDGDEWMQN